jgi:hypothetical protein
MRERFLSGVQTAVAALWLILLSGCAVSPERLGRMQNAPTAATVYVHPVPLAKPVELYAGQFALMALFSKVVYRHDLDATKRKRSACSYLRGSPVPDYGLPYGEGGAWHRWTDGAACADTDTGLAYETYIHRRREGDHLITDMAVIAFRGTENRWGEITDDWRANLSGIGEEPAQYREAQQAVKILVQRLRNTWPEISIYTTGHSLGGGLAQQAAYVSNEIRSAYVFNSSPITNKERLPKRTTGQPQIFHVMTWGEGLAYARDILGRFRGVIPDSERYEFFFPDMVGMPGVEAHDIGLLACKLAVSFSGETADFDFPRTYVVRLSAGSETSPPICPGLAEP